MRKPIAAKRHANADLASNVARHKLDQALRCNDLNMTFPPAISVQRFGFLLMPGFSLLSLACASEVFSAANALLGAECFEVLLLSTDGAAVTAQNAQVVSVSASLELAPSLNGLLIIADAWPRLDDPCIARLRAVLLKVDHLRGVVGGMGCGAAWLAVAGFLNGYRCSVPIEQASRLSSACPAAIVTPHFYEIDRNRITCAGGLSTLDLLMSWLGKHHSERLTQRLQAHLGLERMREPTERQRSPATTRLGASSKLSEAVALMEANLGEPLSTEDISSLVGVSRRQLERLFKQHLDTLPSRWYLEQRLKRARQLLQQTPQSILQIGLSCGFSSGAHFSNAYRNFFERTPRDERSERASAWRNANSPRAEIPLNFPETHKP